MLEASERFASFNSKSRPSEPRRKRPMRIRRPLLIAAGTTFAILCGGVILGWCSLTRDCAREGAEIGFVGCIVGPEPEIDWSRESRRRFVWAALNAPDFFHFEDPEEVREGAAAILRRSARTEDVNRVVASVRRGRYPMKAAVSHLAKLWLNSHNQVPDRLKEMLEGDLAESALACWTLSVLTGHGLPEFTPLHDDWQFEPKTLDTKSIHLFGEPHAKRVEDLRQWLELNEGRPLAELHRESVVHWLETPWPAEGRAESKLARRRIGVARRLFFQEGAKEWRDAVGIERQQIGARQFEEDVRSRALLARRVEQAAPIAFNEAVYRQLAPFARPFGF